MIHERNGDMGITTVNHLIKQVPKFINESTKQPNLTTKQELKQQTGKVMGNQEYLDIITETQNMLTLQGTSLKDIGNTGIGIQHEGLTTMLSWEKKGSKHFFNWQR